VVTITLKNNALKNGDVLRVYCAIESSDINLKDLSSLNKVNNADYYVSLNKPEIFNYAIENSCLNPQLSKKGGNGNAAHKI
jgi:hypothetical protein